MSAAPFDISKIPMSSRYSFIYLERGFLELDGNAVVLRQGANSLTHVPVGSFICLLLGPGIVVTHEAVKACAIEGSLLVWTGEYGVRCYSAGMPGGASGDRILEQAALVLDPQKRLHVARGLYRYMFHEEPPAGRSIDQLRGIEGSRVKAKYGELAKIHKVAWSGRVYEVNDFDASDTINKAISCATHALYSISEAVILAMGYSPAIGFIHSGNARSFVFDVADTIKLDISITIAFEQAAKGNEDIESRVRKACRDCFKTEQIGKRLVTIIEDVLCLS